MNIEFNNDKDMIKLEMLATGQCFISKSKKPSKDERIVFMKTDYISDDDELDFEDQPSEYYCTRLTGDHSGVLVKISSTCLVDQIDFKLVEE